MSLCSSVYEMRNTATKPGRPMITNTSTAGNVRIFFFSRWHYTGLRVYEDLKSIFTLVPWIPALTLNAVLYLAAAPKAAGVQVRIANTITIFYG